MTQPHTQHKTYIAEEYGNIEYRPLTALDCIMLDNFLPIQPFTIKKEVHGAYEDLQHNHGEKNQHKIKVDRDDCIKKLRQIFGICILKHKSQSFDFDIFYQEHGHDSCLILSSLIIIKSTVYYSNKLKDPNSETYKNGHVRVTKTNAAYIYLMAKLYGKTPIEILCQDKSLYNDLDALIFNSFISNIGINQENEAAKSAKQNSKRNKGKR